MSFMLDSLDSGLRPIQVYPYPWQSGPRNYWNCLDEPTCQEAAPQLQLTKFGIYPGWESYDLWCQKFEMVRGIPVPEAPDPPDMADV